MLIEIGFLAAFQGKFYSPEKKSLKTYKLERRAGSKNSGRNPISDWIILLTNFYEVVLKKKFFAKKFE